MNLFDLAAAMIEEGISIELELESGSFTAKWEKAYTREYGTITKPSKTELIEALQRLRHQLNTSE